MPESSSWIHISPQRIDSVIDDIMAGSEPGIRFYLMVVVSTFIASIGLITNSTAVIIGAMLVAPLMTPIFGITLALLLGRPGLLGRALRAEVVGVLMAILIAVLFGSLPLEAQVTPEMLSRTEPNLLDLLVAVFAGFAGSYALVDERLSPSLPGVAIATAIVPPLANTGLCLSVQSYDGASGSFLLFLANFVSILLVAAVVFISAGMVPKLKWGMTWRFLKRFSLAFIGFVVIFTILTHAMMDIIAQRKLAHTIEATLKSELLHIYGATLEREIHQRGRDNINILATVRTAKVIHPGKVKKLENALSERINFPVELIVRSILATDVSALGSKVRVSTQDLDGRFLGGPVTKKDAIIQISEQVLREKLSSLPSFHLVGVDYFITPRGPTVIAFIDNYRVLEANETSELERLIQKRINDSNIEAEDEITLVISSVNSSISDRYGPLLPVWSAYQGQSSGQKERKNKIERFVRAALEDLPDIYPVHFYFDMREKEWKVLVETVGARILTPEELQKIQDLLSKNMELPVILRAWSRIDAMVTPTGYGSMAEYRDERIVDWERFFLRALQEKNDSKEQAGQN